MNRPRRALAVRDGVDNFLTTADAIAAGIELRVAGLQCRFIDRNPATLVGLQTEFLLDELTLFLLPERLDDHVARQNKLAPRYGLRRRSARSVWLTEFHLHTLDTLDVFLPDH